MAAPYSSICSTIKPTWIEITAPDYPGERLVVCRNAALAVERARKRADLLAATERALARIAQATRRKRRPCAPSAPMRQNGELE